MNAPAASCGLLLLLACCAPTLDGRLGQLVGGDVPAALSALGQPNGRHDFTGETVYRWDFHSFEDIPVLSEVSTATALSGSKKFGGVLVTRRFVRTLFSCTIELSVDRNGTVQRFHWAGDPAPCTEHFSASRP